MGAKNNYQNEDLQSLLTSLDAKSTQEKILEVFNKIAGKLLCNYHIVKGENTYDFLEIEFYFYSSNHKDLITYPRKSNRPGMWFFHMSGVDITFGSDAKEGDHPLWYGGILIRSIAKTSEDKKYICGPMKCVDELFDYIYAFEGDISRADIPYINKKEKETIPVRSCCRYIPLLYMNEKERSRKFEELKGRRKKDWEKTPELIKDLDNSQYSVKDFDKFLNRPYRYYRDDDNNWMNGYKAKPKDAIETGL